jgi:hypothetical protein
MAFIRIKRIGGQEYAYSVKNCWTDNGPRQKVSEYLGKVKKIERAVETMPVITSSEYHSILNELVGHELVAHGFMIDSDVFKQAGITVDLAGPSVRAGNGKSLVLAMNEGHLCEATIKALFSFEPKGITKDSIALDLADLLVRAGLKVPPDIFVKLFESLQPKMKIHQQMNLPEMPKEFYY